jgi:hypothetical protein
MFGTARNIALLNEFPHWCVDGTFKVAPQFFTQVYTVHALINNRALPMIRVYVLWRTINLGRQIFDISKKSMQATIYYHFD